MAALDVPLVAIGTSGGDETSRVQARLLDFGFWLQAADGDYGLTTHTGRHGLPEVSRLADDGIGR